MKKKRIFLRGICMLCLFLFFLPSIIAFSVSAEAVELPSLEEASAVYFYHLESDILIASKNTDTVVNAGSSVKVMSGLLACEMLADRMNESVTITEEMLEYAAGHRLHIEAGDVLRVDQLLYAALCGSYNDAFDILACLIGDTRDGFMEMMNQRATELGAKDTVFTDPSGIDDNSRTTATDMAKIAKAAYANDLYMQITSTARYAFEGSLKLGASTIYNRNALISSGTTTQYYNEKCRGMSAGWTSRAGNCVVTSADNGKESYLCIVLGGNDIDNQNFGYIVANRLIDWVYATYTYFDVLSPETVICTLPVTVSDMTSEVEIRTNTVLSCYLPSGVEVGKDITYSVRLMYTSLEAPVTEGTMVGYVAVLYHGKTLGTVPIYTAGTAERSSFVSSLKSIQDLTQNRVFRAGALFFVIVFSGWMITEYAIIRHKRHKWDKYFSMKISTPQKAIKPKHTQQKKQGLPRK